MKVINNYYPNNNFYNIGCKMINLFDLKANVMGCTVLPLESSEFHNHFENEVFFITNGNGIIKNGSEEHNVKNGDVIIFEKFESHSILNTNKSELLNFISLYWEPQKLKVNINSEGKDYLVFSTPPTPNGDLHLGHLSGPYIVADIIKRLQNQTGNHSVHVTGRDDNQTYVVSCAYKENVSSKICADFYANKIQDTWKSASIVLDYFINPENEGKYAIFVKEKINFLKKNGFIEEKLVEILVDDNGFDLHESYINGLCPHCNESSDGNACEACGKPNQCVDLINVREKISQKFPNKTTSKRLFFKLSKFSKELRDYIECANMPAHVYELCNIMINQSLPDICISHRSEWGIKHDIESYNDQIIYVWFEMAFGYLWAAGNLVNSENLELGINKYYTSQSEIVHCYGFDNAYYHTLLFPAVYIALGLTPPKHHIVNELLDLNNCKFSTSRRHLIWGKSFLDLVGSDLTRFILMYLRPEGMRTNFCIEEVVPILNETFFEKFQFIIQSSTNLLKQNDNCVPVTGAWLADQKVFYQSLIFSVEQYNYFSNIESLSVKKMSHLCKTLIDEIYTFLKAQQHLFNSEKKLSNQARTALALIVLSVRTITYMLSPICPDLGSYLKKFYNFDELSKDNVLNFESNQFISDQTFEYKFKEFTVTDLINLLPESLK